MLSFIHMWTRVDFDGLLQNSFHVGGPFSMDHSACLISRGTDGLFVLDSFQRCLYRNIRIIFVWNREYICLLVCTVQSLSRVWHFATPWTAARQASLSITSLLKLMSIKSVMPSNHLILCHPLLLLAFKLSQYQDLSNELVICIRWPNQLRHQSF